MRFPAPAAALLLLGERGQGSGVLAISGAQPRPSVGRVPSYLVETYIARSAARERGAWEGRARGAREERARSAAEELTGEGTRVRFEGSTYVPEDEICFSTFDAPSGQEAALVAQRAELDPLRVVEALWSGKGSEIDE
jgi:hypothetical protein